MLGLLTLIPGLMNSLLQYLTKRVDANVTMNGQNVAADQAVNLAVVQGRIDELKIAAAQRAADRGSLWTEWMMPLLFLPCFTYFAAILFDSLPLFGHVIGSWHISAIPSPYDTVVVGVLGSVAGLKVTNEIGTIARRIFSK